MRVLLFACNVFVLRRNVIWLRVRRQRPVACKFSTQLCAEPNAIAVLTMGPFLHDCDGDSIDERSKVRT